MISSRSRALSPGRACTSPNTQSTSQLAHRVAHPLDEGVAAGLVTQFGKPRKSALAPRPFHHHSTSLTTTPGSNTVSNREGRRVRVTVNGTARWGRLEGERDRARVRRAHRGGRRPTYLAPVEPTKIIATHLTYRSRVEEYAARTPPEPSYFMKPPTTLNGHRGALRRPKGARFLNYEGEVAVVIGTPDARRAPRTTRPRPRRRLRGGQRRRPPRLPPRRPRIDAAGQGPGRVLPDRPRAGARRPSSTRPASRSART